MIPISRRKFLTLAAGTSAVAGGAVAAAHGLRGSSTTAAPPKPPPAVPLVLVALYGGNDGLNTVIPYQDPAYLAARATLGYQPHDVIPLDSVLALNPALTGLKALWDAKQLAIVRGVGYPDPNYSHFRSMDIWQSGVPDRIETSGWLGRWLDTISTHDPLTALALGSTLPKLLQGNMTAGATVPLTALTLPRGIESAFGALETVTAGQADLFNRVAQSGTDLLTVLQAVRGILAASPAAGPSAVAKELDVVAKLIKGGLPTKVYVVSQQGFDTHIEEKQTHQRLLGELDAAITQFLHTMNGQPVVLATFSEFGRRVAQNASGGTDHGSAAPLFVVGPTVKGGFYGDEPGLTNLDNGNLRFTTDFRSVYTTLLTRVLDVDPRPSVGATFPTLPFV